MAEIVISLQKIKDTEVGSIIISRFKDFSCLNEDVEYFLKNKALDFENRNKSRTCIIVDTDTLETKAYYTLSLKTIEFNNTVSKSTIQKIDGYSKSVNAVAVILIGQLGKNSKYSDVYRGADLLDYALDSIYKAQDILGGRICLIETESSIENSKVVDFYLNNDFRILQNDKSDKYIQMFKLL